MRVTSMFVCAFALAACSREDAGETPSAKALSCAASDGGAVSASDAFVREQADADGMTAAYFTLCNGTMAPVTLTGIATGVAGMAELHETRRDGEGVVSMAPTGDIDLAPGELLVFEPGGRHAMLMDLSGPIVAGDTASLVLQFTDGSSVSIDAVARSAADAAGD